MTMHRKSIFLPFTVSVPNEAPKMIRISSFLGWNSLHDRAFIFIQRVMKSSNQRPKKKIYHRDYDLDRVMELQKKPTLILQLKNIIMKQKNQSLLLRDLEKEVGVVQKWNLMAVIERYPSIFNVTGGNRRPHILELTQKAKMIAEEEETVLQMMEPIVITNLRKLLMMSMDCRIPITKISMIQSELGLPENFTVTLIPRHPELFSLQDSDGKLYLQLESWDSSLAVTAREERSNYSSILHPNKKAQILKDGNFCGPFAFKMNFAPGFRPHTKYLEEMQKWQKLAFPSPYLNARQFEPVSPQARKRAVAVLHEVLSLMQEKRLTSAQLDAFHAEFQLPCRLLLCLVKNHGIFYITNKGIRSTVFLKEAYQGSCLMEKSPILRFNDRLIALTGRKELSLNSTLPSKIEASNT